MKFSLFTFGSDYLKENFISLESCSLLRSSLPKKTPRVFFTRNLHKDHECDILVVEMLKKDFLTCERTQKLAKTVLVTSTPFKSLDFFLSLGIDCSLICMNEKTILFSSGTLLEAQEETEIQRFNRIFDVERGYDLSEYSRFLDVRLLRSPSWLVGPIRNGTQNEAQPEISSQCIVSEGDAATQQELCEPRRFYYSQRASRSNQHRKRSFHKRVNAKRKRISLDDSFVDEVECIEANSLDFVYIFTDDNLFRILNRQGFSTRAQRRNRRRLEDSFEESLDTNDSLN